MYGWQRDYRKLTVILIITNVLMIAVGGWKRYKASETGLQKGLPFFGETCPAYTVLSYSN